MANFSYEVTTTIGVLSKEGDWQLELNYVSWSKRKPVLDLRRWHYDEYGEADRMSKGLTLKEDELKALYELLKKRYEEG